MPCEDSSSSIALKLDKEERFISFEFSKITCGRKITSRCDYNSYCKGKILEDILNISFQGLVEQLKVNDEEDQFLLYVQWDALRSAIAHYLGVDDDTIDKDRCQIESIKHDDEHGMEIVQVILPPKDMPKILPCSQEEV